MKPIAHIVFERIPAPPYLVGLLTSLVFFVGYFAFAMETGLVAQTIKGEVSSINIRATLTLMVLIGYLPCAHWYLRRWTLMRMQQLQKQFELPKAVQVISSVRLLTGGGLGLIAFVAMFLVIPGENAAYLHPWLWSLDYAVVAIAISCVGWWAGVFSIELIWSALLLTAMANRLPALNLFDTEANKPFVQQGVQSALLIVIMMSITGNIAVQPEGGFIGSILVSTTMLMLALVALVLPVRGIHRKIQNQKRKELFEIRRLLQFENQKRKAEGRVIDGEILGLLAIEARIESVPEWPFDMGSLSRVILYLLLGLGSWVGAALVERLLENAW
ncbi:MAG: hypothetical protein ACI9FB_002009 [Candidatus Azotimanducaceae bacterium]|jgi:hypothetical protein